MWSKPIQTSPELLALLAKAKDPLPPDQNRYFGPNYPLTAYAKMAHKMRANTKGGTS